MSEHDGGVPHSNVPPPPPVVPDASELVVESAPVKHFPAHGSDLVQSVGPNGDMAWTLFIKPRADIEKPEPVSDRTEMDH